MIFADGAIALELDPPLATLTLNRPAARNALNLAMWTDLPAAVARVARDGDVRGLIVRGAGGDFASGADISQFPEVFADHAAALAYGARIEAATGALAALPMPVIALIEGYCIGAGLAVALACDLRIAAEGAKLGAPPARLGLIYSLSDTRRLVNAVGASAAKAMLFGARLHAAPEALRLGLVDEVHSGDRLEAEVAARARGMAALSASSIRRAKTLVGMVVAGAVEETEETRSWFAEAATGADFAEGLDAFQTKRAPVFK